MLDQYACLHVGGVDTARVTAVSAGPLFHLESGGLRLLGTAADIREWLVVIGRCVDEAELALDAGTLTAVNYRTVEEPVVA